MNLNTNLSNFKKKHKSRQNQIILFPSYLGHYVKKTSDAITIAGTLYMNFD